jgi:23S rRNA pseudouridine2605 synthase
LREGTGIHPVGRLDYNSTGALLLTNDGVLTQQLTHPRYHLSKTYRVVVQGKPTAKTLQQWRQGIMLDGRPTLPADVKVVTHADSQQTELEIVLYEGRNRQIRRVAEMLGHPVKRLHRLAIGGIELNALPAGHVRPLSSAELDILKVGIEKKVSSPRLQNHHFDRY